MTEPKSPYAEFTERLRHESAKPLVARARNFVAKFPAGLSRYDAADQVHNFLSQCEKWMFSECIVFEADADEQGILNASEGLEKLILCRLFDKVFQIDPTDDDEDVMMKKHIDGLAWVENEHLGIPNIELSLWPRVIDELRRMDQYKAPADKLVCVVNACHVINDVLKRTQAELGASRPLSADDFLPLLIHAIIKANPPRLHSNVEFVAAFRHPSRLNGEYAYWITMLMSAKEFVKQAGPATLDVTPEEYTRLYEASLEATGHKVKAATAAVASDEGREAASDSNDALGSCHVAGGIVKVPGANCLAMTVEDQAEELEQTLLDKPEVSVYQLPDGLTRYRSKDWQKVIWTGQCRVVAKAGHVAIKMIDRSSGRLFAECLIPAAECENYVQPASDSCQHFVLKITNEGRTATVGLGFEHRNDASEFKQVLFDTETAGKASPASTFDDAFLSAQASSSSSAPASTSANTNGYLQEGSPKEPELVDETSQPELAPDTKPQPDAHPTEDPFQGLGPAAAQHELDGSSADNQVSRQQPQPVAEVQQACFSQDLRPTDPGPIWEMLKVADVHDSRIQVPA